jgi:N-acetylglutamate synthase-like GNAT family acetyltransferase
VRAVLPAVASAGALAAAWLAPVVSLALSVVAMGLLVVGQVVWRLLGDTADAIDIRPAQLSEREKLERLQRRSSMHQPMYRRELAAHPDAIELPVGHITAELVRVAEQNEAIVGFAVLLDRDGEACELDGLFVEPARMRAGVGRRLVDDAKQIARERGATRIDVVANPQAVAFYEAVGFIAVGEAQTRFGPAPQMSLSITRAASST